MAPVTTEGLELAVALSLFHMKHSIVPKPKLRSDVQGSKIRRFLVLLTCAL